MSTTETDRPDFGPPPPCDLVVEPTDEQVEMFWEQGFLVVEQLTSTEELEWLRAIMEWIFTEDVGNPLGPIDRSGSDRDDASTLQQAFFPEVRFPAILDSAFRRNAHRMAAALMRRAREDLSTWGHMILKPARIGREAPWHQDAAYWEPELDYDALGCWLPLHAVTVDQGAMQFVPGSHRLGLVQHEHADAPEHNLLRAVDVDTSRAVGCPLPAGGATFHHFLTLHHTAPNTSERDRWAFPMEYQVTPTVRSTPREMAWVDQRRSRVGTPDPIVYVADGRFVPVELPTTTSGRRRTSSP